MIKGYQSSIIKVYENIRESEQKSLNLRREEIEKRIPEVIKIEKEIARLCLKLSISILNNAENKDIYLKELKEKSQT